MNYHEEKVEKPPVMGNCGKCGREYNTRTGAFDGKLGMICMECYKEVSKPDWELCKTCKGLGKCYTGSNENKEVRNMQKDGGGEPV